MSRVKIENTDDLSGRCSIEACHTLAVCTYNLLLPADSLCAHADEVLRQVSTRRLCNSSIIKLDVIWRWNRICYIGSNQEATIRHQNLRTEGSSVPVTGCRNTEHSWSIHEEWAHIALTVPQDTLSRRYLSPQLDCASSDLPDFACEMIYLRKINIKTAWLSYEKI